MSSQIHLTWEVLVAFQARSGFVGRVAQRHTRKSTQQRSLAAWLVAHEDVGRHHLLARPDWLYTCSSQALNCIHRHLTQEQADDITEIALHSALCGNKMSNLDLGEFTVWPQFAIMVHLHDLARTIFKTFCARIRTTNTNMQSIPPTTHHKPPPGRIQTVCCPSSSTWLGWVDVTQARCWFQNSAAKPSKEQQVRSRSIQAG